MYSGAGAFYMANYNETGNTLHLFGDTNATSFNYLKLQPLLNTSYNPLIVQGNTTINSNLNVLGNIYAANLPNVSTFNIVITNQFLLILVNIINMILIYDHIQHLIQRSHLYQ